MTGLAGHAGGLANDGGAAPPATASALGTLGSTLSVQVARLGDSVSGMGSSTELAASLYERADADSMTS